MNTARPTRQENPSRAAAPPPGAASDPYSDIARLARSCGSRAKFLSRVIQRLVSAFSSPYGAVHARSGAEVIQDDAHWGPTDPRFWKESVQQFLTESLTEARSRAKLLQARDGAAKVALLSAPLFDPSGPSIGAAALVVPLREEGDWTTRLAALEGLCRFASICLELVGRRSQPPSGTGGPDAGMARAAAAESVEEFAFALTNELRNKLGCEQIALALVRRNHVQILSISGLDDVNRRSPGVASLRAAMEECLDARKPILHPRNEDWVDHHGRGEYPLHKQWHLAAKGDAVASIPLLMGDSIAAVLSLRIRGERRLTPEKLDEIGARVELHLPGLLLARRASRSLPAHLWESARTGLATLTAPGRIQRKIVAAVVLLGVGTLLFGSMSYDLTVRSVVTPMHVRHLHAPFGGVLAATRVVPGDRVRAGDVLCELDQRDLDQQRTELSAQLEVLERERDRATAANAPVEAQLALANQQLVAAKLAIVNRRIEQAVVRAPADGVVVRGDLRSLVGAVLAMGDPLFQVAPVDRWTLELEGPDHAAEDLTPGLKGAFASVADPRRLVPFSVARVRAASEVRNARNVYVAEADVEARGPTLKPGMEGVARLEVGRRPVAWVLTHRLWDYLRLHFWL